MEDDLQKRFAKAFLSVMHSVHCLAGKAVKGSEVPPAQYRLLMLLRQHGPLSVNQIAELSAVAQSTASELAARAVEGGLLERVVDEQDARRSLFKLSAEAQKLLRRRKRQLDQIVEAVLEPLSTDQKQKLVEAFETIVELMQITPPQKG